VGTVGMKRLAKNANHFNGLFYFSSPLGFTLKTYFRTGDIKQKRQNFEFCLLNLFEKIYYLE
jgi:hypothetical protein